MNNSYTSFGLYIERIRKERNVSSVEIARALDVSKSYFSLVIHGKRDIPVGWIAKLGDFFNLGVEEKQKLEYIVNNTNHIKRISVEDFRKCLYNFAENIGRDQEDRENLKKRMEEFIQNILKTNK